MSSAVCDVKWFKCHWSKKKSCFFSTYTHTSQTMCVVLRIRGSVVSLKTGVMSSTGRDKITYPRIPSDLPIPDPRLTAVEPRKVRKPGKYCIYSFSSMYCRQSITETGLYIIHNAQLYNIVITWICSVSFDPRTIECCLVRFRVLHVHWSITAAHWGGQGSSAFSTF